MFLITFFLTGLWSGIAARADEMPAPPPQPEAASRAAALYHIAQEFVTRISRGFDAADAAMGLPPGARQAAALLPEGETLMFTVILPHDLALDGVVTAQVENHTVLLSLRDYFSALQFPITIDAKAGTAQGWYISENKKFALDLSAHSVKANGHTFRVSENVKAQGDDILAPVQELANWFDFKSSYTVSDLQLKIESPTPLPIEQRLARKNRNTISPQSKPQYPLVADDTPDVGFPLVDVSSLASYSKDGSTGKVEKHIATSVSTKGDFQGGRLVTVSQFNDQDNLSSLRASYVRETLKPELLGPLKARRYELGDLSTPLLPMDTHSYQGTGARVSNVDPSRVYINSSTAITGNAPPGWEVELYRDSQYIDTQTVGADGLYTFDNVDLFRSRNDFRVVMYGPQGEREEEPVSIPVDPSRLSDEGMAYDVALVRDNTQLYRAGADPQNAGDLRLSAIVEKPVGKESAVQLGLSSAVRGAENDRVTTAHTALSTVAGPALLNAEAAVEDTGEAGAQLVARVDIGQHQLRDTLSAATDRFGLSRDQTTRNVLENEFIASGPLSAALPGKNPRYNVNLDVFRDNEGERKTFATLGYSGTFGRVNLNQQVQYRAGGETGNEAHSLTSLRGFVKGVYVRGDIDYRVAPDAVLDTWALNLQRYVNEKLDLEFNHREEPDDNYAENTIQANIRTGYATVSPSLTRNSSGDVIAYVNTSFGLSRDPATKKLVFSDEQAGATGNLSAFVFLDKDGDGVFDGQDEPIENATVVAVQNGGQATTGKDGYAHLKQLQHFRQSDLYILPDSLPDPFWVPARAGVSFLPRQGHVTQIALPINIAGQIEGNVFTQEAPPKRKKTKHAPPDEHLGAVPAGGVTLSLYNVAGEKMLTTTTEGDGYYIFSPVPPGQYALVIDSTGRPAQEYRRPDPLPIKIGYDGTDLTGRNLYLTAGPDIAMRVVSDLKTIQAADPALSAKTLEDKTVVLNLGQYHSRLLMSVMWFKLQKTAHKAVKDLTPLVEPSESYADATTGEHTLRVGAAALDLKDAKSRCEAITKAGVACTVEVLPGGMKLAQNDVAAKEKAPH